MLSSGSGSVLLALCISDVMGLPSRQEHTSESHLRSETEQGFRVHTFLLCLAKTPETTRGSNLVTTLQPLACLVTWREVFEKMVSASLKLLSL